MRRLFFLSVFVGLAALVGCYHADNPVAPEPTASVGLVNLTPDELENYAADRAALRDRVRAQREQNRLSIQRMGGMKKFTTPTSATLVVPDDFATIQAAVNAASPGDKIVVKDKGSDYNEDVYIDVEYLKITGQGIPTVDGRFTIDEANGVKIEYFTIDGNEDPPIDVLDSDDVHITDNTIHAPGSEGIVWDTSHNIFIRHNDIEADVDALQGFESLNPHIFWNMITSSDADGIDLNDNDGAKIFGNTIMNCDSDGMDIDGGSNYNIHKNTVSGCDDSGIRLDAVSNSKVGPDNVFDGNDIGINILSGSDNNRILKNYTCNNATDIVDDGMNNKLINNKTRCP